MKEDHSTPTASALRAYANQISRHRRLSIPALLMPGTGAIFTNYIPPLVIAMMMTHFGTAVPSSLDEALPYIVLLTASWLFGEVIWRIAFLFLNHAVSRGVNDLYLEAFDAILQKDISFFNDNFTGSLTKKIIGYSKSYEGFMDTLAFLIIGKIFPLVFACIVMWTISPWLVFALLSLILLTLLCVMPFIRRRKKLTAIRETKSNEVAGHVSDVLGNIAAVQAFAHDDLERAQHESLTGHYVKSMVKSWDYHVTRVDMIVSPLYVTANVIGLILAISLTDDAATMAAIFLTFSYFSQATMILFEFNRTYRNIENAMTEAGQFCELMVDQPKIIDSSNAKQLAVSSASIDFQSASFAYEDAPDDLLFDQLNLHIPDGQKIAIVGRSGGGKTTITKLLLRFNDIQSGSISIGGQDISDATIRSLRHSIAYVPQDPAMFHRSLTENIRYGRPDATDNEVIDAARKAHALEFIDKLPAGFDTIVGERGVKLSGGQRQRIAIARAILKDAPILVLDEATSALDSESEKLIQSSLNELMKDRTSIVIAHRLSTIQKMDRILVLDNGKIIEDGTHTELTRLGGTYATLWSHQSGGFIDE